MRICSKCLDCDLFLTCKDDDRCKYDRNIIEEMYHGVSLVTQIQF